ncbi:hypothetical protein GCM10009827_115830 [Dactylosporangium maewongense]|uniref:Glycosyltransferase RgtA/B/C/D-like domain-containing protein n=1 Tax=Dactylosporangium maewongense TaxID=634393 RepID=A0ABP4P6T1_9ACTN
MIVVPLLTFVAVACLCLRLGGGVRLALLRAAVITGGAACLAIEALSSIHALHRPAVIVAWLLALAVLSACCFWFVRRSTPAGFFRFIRRSAPAEPEISAFATSWCSARARWAGLARVERLIVGVLCGLFLLDLVVALVAPPNNYDSQTYHLPKIEHWVQRGDVDFYPTIIDRQLAMAPGAEYLLLHLRLLTGGDGYYNLVQLAAGVGVVLAASRIAGQLGGGTRAQLITALIVGTTPMVVLEATSTQTDLVVALWVACVATFTLDGLRARSGTLDTLLIGTAAGLTLLTKATGLLAAGLLLLVWVGAQLRLRWWRGLVAALATGALMLLLAGPSLLRVQQTYDNPLGPAHLRESISMQRHDPASVLVNGLRIAETALQTPIGPLNDALAAGIIGIAGVLGVDPQARDITYWNEKYPYMSWPPDEDRVSLPAQGVLILLGALLLAFRKGTRLYAGVFWLALLAYVITVKWQPWGNRLIVFLIVLGAPLAGLWIASLAGGRAGAPTGGGRFASLTSPADGHAGGGRVGALTGGGRVAGVTGRRAATWMTTGALAVGVAAGGFAVAYGWPRRLVGHGSIFTTSQMEQRFIREPQWQRDYEWAAAAVRASGARRVGLVQGYNTWEYPWWILLPGTEIVSLQSLQPNLPAASNTTVDAMVCVKPIRPCEFYSSPTWQVHRQGDVAYVIIRSR